MKNTLSKLLAFMGLRKMKTCKTCAFRDGRGACTSEKIAEDETQTPAELSDMLVYTYSEGGCFLVGENFGCLHHKAKPK